MACLFFGPGSDRLLISQSMQSSTIPPNHGVPGDQPCYKGRSRKISSPCLMSASVGRPCPSADDLCVDLDSDLPFEDAMSSRPFSGPPATSPTDGRAMGQPDVLPTLTARMKGALHPVVMQNVQLRRGCTADSIPPERFQDAAKDLLTDELCGSFVGKMRLVLQQLQALKTNAPLNRPAEAAHRTNNANGNTNGVSGANGTRYVPRSVSEAIVSTSQGVTQSERGKVPLSYLPTPPVSASLSNAPRFPKAMVRENGWNTTSVIAPTATRFKSPIYSPSRQRRDQGHKDRYWKRSDQSSSSGYAINTTPPASQSQVLPSHPSPTNRDESPLHGISIPMDPTFFTAPPSSIGEDQPSYSPSPSRFSRPRRTSSGTWPHSPSDHHTPSSYHSPTSHHHRNSPSSYRRRSPSPSYRYASRRGMPPSSEPHKSKLSPPWLNGNHHHADLRSYSPQRSIELGVDSNSYSYPGGNFGPDPGVINTSSGDHSILPMLSSSPNILHVQHQKDRKSLVDINQCINSTQNLLNPCHNVPGLWFVKTGCNSAAIAECVFEVDKKTAVEWELNKKSVWVNLCNLLPECLPHSNPVKSFA
jgi:hypothetical protein